MEELEANFFAGLSWHFGGGKSYMSGTAGIGISRRMHIIQPGINFAINVYNGGIGALEDSNNINLDAILTGKITAGAGHGNAMDVYPLHLDSGTGMEDRFKYSATIGTNFILNNSGRNQQVGFLQLRAGDFSFQTYNDFSGFKKIGISDGYDRWWTGGGNITLGAKNSSYQLVIASDVFTADTDSFSETDRLAAENNLESFNSTNTGNWYERTSSKMFDYTPTKATEVDSDFLKQSRNNIPWDADKHSFGLNQGRTSFRGNTPNGSFGINGRGSGHMYSQDMIHRAINFHLIPSERPNQWEFQVTPKVQKSF